MEQFTGGSVVQWNEYLFADGRMVGVRFNRSDGNIYLRYFIGDHLGSTTILTDETAAVVERDSYDAWGKRRNPDGSDDPTGALVSQTTRGFTGQEHIPTVGLINYNARIYNPTIGRFLSADSLVPGAYDGQSYNRYAYVLNNPLTFVDPTGNACVWTTEAGVTTGGCTGGYYLGQSPSIGPVGAVVSARAEGGAEASIEGVAELVTVIGSGLPPPKPKPTTPRLLEDPSARPAASSNLPACSKTAGPFGLPMSSNQQAGMNTGMIAGMLFGSYYGVVAAAEVGAAVGMLSGGPVGAFLAGVGGGILGGIVGGAAGAFVGTGLDRVGYGQPSPCLSA